VRVEPAVSVVGHAGVPGDKSISHRAVMLGALGEGETVVRGFGRGGDTEATVHAMRALGAGVDDVSADELLVHGVGLRGLSPPDGPVDCENAGTLIRLVAGVLAGQEGRFELTGDESLRTRPMERIAEPLRRMGAQIETTDGHAPIVIDGSASLAGIDYELPVASAQVKSAVLLAGLNATGATTVVEPAPTRDHAQNMAEITRPMIARWRPRGRAARRERSTALGADNIASSVLSQADRRSRGRHGRR